MMKRRLLLLVAALTMMIGGAKADTLDVCMPWDAAYNQLPFHGAYADYGFRTEFIYANRWLAPMTGGVITELTFYSYYDSLTYDETFTLYMEEVDDTVCSTSAWQMSSAAQQVWSGVATVSNNVWHVVLDSAFVYTGGHLLLSVICDGMTGGLWPTSLFQVYHTGQDGANPPSAFRDANAQHILTGPPSTVLYALPSATFTYLPSNSIVCHRPETVHLDSVWPHGVTISWDSVDGSLGYEWTLTNGQLSVASGQTTATSVNVSGLQQATNYVFQIHTLCDSGAVSQDKSLTFMTACGTITAADMPYFEDFESYTTSSYAYEIPCWNLMAYSRELYLHVEHYTSGNNILNFWPDSNNTPHFAVMPEMQNIPALNMTFKVRGLDGAILQVGVMTDPNDTLTFVPVAMFDSVIVWSEWHEVEVDFATFIGSTGHIAFRAGMAPDQSRRFIEVDSIVVNIAPGCSQMQGIAISNVTATTADLTINDTDTAGATYTVTVVSDAGTVYQFSIFNSQFSISSLTPTTDYTVTVQKHCADSTAHLPLTVSFHTLCGPVTVLPWSESFEDCGSALPECWSTLNSNANVLSVGGTIHSGPGSHALWAYSAITPELIVLLPEFAMQPDSLLLGLDVLRYQYGNDSAAGVEVGIMTDAADASTFVPVATCIPDDVWSWEHYQALFPGYTSGRIALRFLYVANVAEAAHTIVDNITVDVLPASLPDTCAQPSSLYVSNIRGDGAVLHIASPMTVPHYMVYVDSDSVEVFSSVYTITGLAADSLYTVGVSSICADSSLTARTEVQFRTAICPLQPLPWSEDFDGVTTNNTDVTAVLSCWERCGQGASTVNNVYGTTNNRLKLTLGSYQRNNVVVLPDLQGDLNTMEMSFTSDPRYPYNSTTQVLQVGYTMSTTDTASFRPIASFNAADYVINYNTYPRTETVAFSGVPYGARIALRVPVGDMTLEWYIDDIEVHQVQQCPRPQAVAAIHIGSDTAVIHISDTTPGQTYSVTVVSDGDTVTQFSIFNSQFSISSLSPATDYTISVSTLCPDSTMTAPVTCQFRTMCQPLASADIPYVLDFESTPDEPCWRYYKLLDDGSIVVEDNLARVEEDDAIFAGAQSGTHSLAIGAGFNTPVFWVLPAVDWLGDKVLEFGYRSGYGAHVSYNYRADIGIMTDPLDPTTFVLVDSITSVTDTYQTEVIDFDYPVIGKYIAIINYSDGSLTIDDLRITAIEPPVGIQPAIAAAVSVYPNPARGSVTVEADAATVTLLDLCGRTVKRWSLDGGSMTADISAVPRGAYFVRVVTRDGVTVRKLIVE